MKTSKRIISFLLTIVMTLSIVPMAAVQSGAATVTLQQLQSKYPHGKYWNGGNANSYTSNPCTHHGNCSYSGSCGCNSFKGHAIQCMGFAYQLAYLVYGGDPYVDWKSNKNVSALDSLKAGDVVRYKNNGHSIFVAGVSGNTVTYADCNSDGHCKIRWNQTIQKSELRASFSYVDPAPYAWNPSSGPHTHSYSGRYFEAAHPHKVYKKCSCGATQYTGETVAYASCSTCMHLSWSYVMPVKAYTINTGKTTVYNAVNGTAKTNKIYDTDLCTISEIYDCGWCKVTFPLNAGGTETGYCKINVFMKSGGYIMYASKQITTYRRSDLKTTVGKTAIGDKIYVLGTSGSSVQIAYPLDTKTWQVGWVPTSAIKCTISYNANGGSGTMASTSVQYNNSFTLSNPDMTVAGTKTVTVTYSGKTTSFTITVNNPPAVVSSIAIQSKPTKTVYTVGEKFDASGLSVKVTMSDGTTKTITSGFTLSNPDMTVTGTKTVTVTYSGKTASFTITVKAAEPSVNAGTLRLITPASARIGQTVQIPVQLDKASLGTLTFTVTYDRTKLKYVSCTESAFDMCDAYAGNAGVVKLACIDNTAVSAGRIAVLTFEVIAPAACLTDLTVAIEEAYDGSDKAVSLAGGTWNLSVVKTLLGDVNGDGKITAIDARWALQAASGARMLTEEQKAAADANGDGKITAIDARWILQAASGSRVL